jgi:predicted small secreted protein
MNKQSRAASAAMAAVCLVLASCESIDGMGRQEKALNEQAAWAAAQGIARDRPQATGIAKAQDGKIRLTAEGLTGTSEAADSTPPAAPAARPAPLATAAVEATSATPPSAAAEAQADSDRRQVLTTILAWRKAWMDGDAVAYINYYDAGFKGDLATRAAWERQRKDRLANGRIVVRIENMAVRLTGADTAQADFTQRYASARSEDVGVKVLKLRRQSGQWRIVEEVWRKG